MESKKYKNLLAFVLLSLSILLVYDLFNFVGTRGEVGSSRNFPRASRIVLLVIYALSILSINISYKSKFNRIINLIFGLIIIQIIISGVFSISALTALSKSLFLFFTYLFFHKVFLTMPLTSKKYIKKFVLFSIISLSLFIVITRIENSSEITKIYADNNAYHLLSFMPFIYILNFKRKNILLLILTVAIFFSLKRGAILALIIALIPLIFNLDIAKNNIILKWIKNLVFIILSYFVISYVLENFQDIILERTADLSMENTEGIGSGRGIIYSLIFFDWLNSNNIFIYLFGFGYNSVQVFTEVEYGKSLTAHSDFLNFIHSYGLLGLSLLSWFILHQRKIASRLLKRKSQYFVPYYMIFIIFSFKAVYSGNFEYQSFSYLLICYALLNVLVANQKIRI